MLQVILRIIAPLILLSACQDFDAYKHHDAVIKMDQSLYDQQLTRPPIASLEPKVTAPTIPEPVLEINEHINKIVSLTVTQELAIKDVFINLARQAGINIMIDPSIQGGITLYAKQRKFIDILRDVCQMTGLRYKIFPNSVQVEADTPYLKSYNIQYLTFVRENQSRISIATDVFTAVEGQKTSLDNGSNNLLTSHSKNDFWQELENNIATILSQSVNPNRPDSESKYSMHKHAGIISIFATEFQQLQIEAYLKMLEQSIATQVLIEAKIVEVNLKDEFKSGINWNSLKGDFVLHSPLGALTTPGFHDARHTPVRDTFTIGGKGNHLTGLLNLMQKFGTVRTLANPRLTVMNNQSAVLKVATNQVFFRINYDHEYATLVRGERENVSSQIQTVPIGLVMVVHPSINVQNNNIIMSLRPTISRVVAEKEDPAVAIASKQTQQALIPEVQVREFDTVVNIPSGGTVVLAGLMEERSDNEQAGVPWISELPGLGDLFRGKSNERGVTELVVFIRATIIDNQANQSSRTSSITPADQHVYQTFTRDSRPLVF